MCDIIYFLIIAAGLYGGSIYLKKLWLQKKLDRFEKSKCPKDIVILHGTRRSKVITSPSPFVMKLETFLRMAKIQYEYDGNPSNTFGPKGKTPWITLNGEHVADTEMCIEFLTKKFNVQIKNNYTEKQLAVGNLVRTLLEDRIFWEIVMWAFVWGGEGRVAVQKVLKVPMLIVRYAAYNYSKLTWAHGIARHPKDVVERWTHRDMKTISATLGDNKFLLGDEPCVEDAALFGFCAALLWGFPAESPYCKTAKEKLPNIEAYCNRMKELYYPDWNDLLIKPKSS